VINVGFRIINIIGNELVVYWIILSSDLGDLGGLGLIINFASAMVICELDDIIFDSARIHSLKENFNNLESKKFEDNEEAG
jgi:hypothetical protein